MRHGRQGRMRPCLGPIEDSMESPIGPPVGACAHGNYISNNSRNPSSSSTGTPSRSAFSRFDPALSPATT